MLTNASFSRWEANCSVWLPGLRAACKRYRTPSPSLRVDIALKRTSLRESKRGNPFQPRSLSRTSKNKRFFPQILICILENSHFANPYSTDHSIEFQLHFNFKSIPVFTRNISPKNGLLFFVQRCTYVYTYMCVWIIHNCRMFKTLFLKNSCDEYMSLKRSKSKHLVKIAFRNNWDFLNINCGQ